MLLKIVYLLVRRLLGLVALTARRDLAKDAELLGRDDSKDSAADTTRELLCREMDTHGTSRVHRPDADLRRTASSIGPRRVRRPLQPAQAPPVPPATTARSGRPGYSPAGLASSAAEGARRRDQRVLPGWVADLMNPQVKHRAMGFEAVQAIGHLRGLMLRPRCWASRGPSRRREPHGKTARAVTPGHGRTCPRTHIGQSGSRSRAPNRRGQ